jgi:hypothetical protein
MIQVAVFWVVMPYSDAVGHQRFGGPRCLHLQEAADQNTREPEWPVSTLTRLRAGRPSFDSRQRREFLSLPQCATRVWYPPSLISKGYWGLFLGVKGTDREANHISIYCRSQRMSGAIPPLILLYVVVLNEAQGATFSLLYLSQHLPGFDTFPRLFRTRGSYFAQQ